ncbi:uncharacterized protein PV07_04722 [Cladophialophora immunda]|uniref:Uncharacterized protein n=1 Tax=Cladophialophora immunda TaxID=569365 RepID=A0A0D2CZ57_9EURO|nr:uncharacterized protein PV07_04722 [Cladophialophora immunda]KIW28859.1 hypothetical protein PV07_04722 [Cladophialophora immunda]
MVHEIRALACRKLSDNIRWVFSTLFFRDLLSRYFKERHDDGFFPRGVTLNKKCTQVCQDFAISNPDQKLVQDIGKWAKEGHIFHQVGQVLGDGALILLADHITQDSWQGNLPKTKKGMIEGITPLKTLVGDEVKNYDADTVAESIRNFQMQPHKWLKDSSNQKREGKRRSGESHTSVRGQTTLGHREAPDTSAEAGEETESGHTEATLNDAALAFHTPTSHESAQNENIAGLAGQNTRISSKARSQRGKSRRIPASAFESAANSDDQPRTLSASLEPRIARRMPSTDESDAHQQSPRRSSQAGSMVLAIESATESNLSANPSRSDALAPSAGTGETEVDIRPENEEEVREAKAGDLRMAYQDTTPLSQSFENEATVSHEGHESVMEYHMPSSSETYTAQTNGSIENSHDAMTSALTTIPFSNPRSYGSKETGTTTVTATRQHTYNWSPHPEVQQVLFSLPALHTDLNTGNGAPALSLDVVEDVALPPATTVQSSSNKKRKRPVTEEVRSEAGGTAQHPCDWSPQRQITLNPPVSILASRMNLETGHGFVMKPTVNLLSEDATRAELETHAPFDGTASFNFNHIVDSNARTEATLANRTTIFSNFETHDGDHTKSLAGEARVKVRDCLVLNTPHDDHTLLRDINTFDLSQFAAPTVDPFDPFDLSQLAAPTVDPFDPFDLSQLAAPTVDPFDPFDLSQLAAPTVDPFDPFDLSQLVTPAGDTFDERMLANLDGRAFEQSAFNTSTNSASGLSMFTYQPLTSSI